MSGADPITKEEREMVARWIADTGRVSVDATNFIQRYEAALSAAEERVKELEAAALQAETCINAMHGRALRFGLRGTAEWDKIAFDSLDARDALGRARAALKETAS